jgi:hypothetical protein
MDLADKIAVRTVTPTLDYNDETVKFDRFTNSAQNGVMKSRVYGTAVFNNTANVPAKTISGFGGANYATIKAVTDGSFTFNHNGTPYSLTGLNVNGNGNITDMDSLASESQAYLRIEVSDDTILVTYADGKFTVTSEEADVFFSANGTGTDLGALMALIPDYHPVVTPLTTLEGYTSTENEPEDLTSFYRFRNNLDAAIGSDLTAVEGTPTYSTVGSLGAVGTSSELCLLQGLAPLPNGAFEVSFTLRANALPSEDVAAVALLTQEANYNTVYGFFSLTDDGTLGFELDTKTGAGKAELAYNGISANTTYLIKVSYDGTTGVELSVNNSVADTGALNSAFDFSASQYITFPLGTGEVDTGVVAFDGKIMNVGIFGAEQTSGYWTDIYNGGSVKPLYYGIEGTVVCTFSDVPDYVSSIKVTIDAEIFEQTNAQLFHIDLRSNNASEGINGLPNATQTVLPSNIRDDMNGCIVTVTVNPGTEFEFGQAIVRGLVVNFYE